MAKSIHILLGHYRQLLAIFPFLGAGQGLYALNSILLVNKHFKAKVGLAMGLFVCGTGSGGLIMPQVNWIDR